MIKDQDLGRRWYAQSAFDHSIPTMMSIYHVIFQTIPLSGRGSRILSHRSCLRLRIPL